MNNGRSKKISNTLIRAYKKKTGKKYYLQCIVVGVVVVSLVIIFFNTWKISSG